MEIAVCDNEKFFCNFIKDALESIKEENQIDCFDTGDDLLKAAEKKVV